MRREMGEGKREKGLLFAIFYLYNSIRFHTKTLSPVFLILLLLSAPVYSQPNSPYLIPRHIFVGDRASLVVPLSSVSTANITATANLPSHEYIDFHRITLDANRLVIEFTAFAPGELELPIIEIGGHYFPNLTITVNSVVDRKSAITLSAPASSLAMPGTAILLYGLMALIIFILLAAIWFILKGKTLFLIWKEKWKRFRLFTNMRHTERRLYKSVNKGIDKRKILDSLSLAFRNFLSVLTGLNCRAMTAYEFMYEFTINNSQFTMQDLSFAGKFIGVCDEYRFSGNKTSKDEIFQLLKELREFLDEAEKWQK